MSSSPPSESVDHPGLPVATTMGRLSPSAALRLLHAQELAGLGTYEYDLTCDQLIASPSLRALLGASDEDPMHECHRWVHPEDYAAYQATRAAAQAKAGIYQLQHRVIRNDGTLIHVHSHWESHAIGGAVTRIVGAVHDITGLKAVEEALRISEERWELALASSNEGVWDWDLRSNTFYISEHLAGMLGLAGEGLVRDDDWMTRIHPEDRGRMMRAIAEHLEGRTDIYRIEQKVRHSNGTFRLISARGSAIRDPEGKPYRLIGVSTDITERRRLEKEWREREELLRTSIEASFDSFVIFKAIRDHDGRIEDFEYVEINKMAAQFLGLTREEIIGQSFKKLYPRGVETGLFERYVRVTETRVPLDEEFAFDSLIKVGKWIHQQVIPVRDGVAVTIADITERKIAEQALKANEKLVQRIATSVPEFICIFDLVEKQSIYRNRSLVKSLHYEVENPPMLDIPTLFELVHPDDRVLIQQHFEQVLAAPTDEAIQVQVRMIDGCGRDQWFLIRSMTFQRDAEGRPIHALASAQQITDIKRYEIQLREQMDELEAARRELEDRHRELEKLNERLANLASRDGLTDVYNHRAFQNRLSEEVARARRHGVPLSILLTDVDNFKMYNDRYGHPAGDERLKEFAQSLLGGVRNIDFVARYGGEEFAIILPNTVLEEAKDVAQRILDHLHLCEGEHCMTASFGCAQFEPDGPGESQLIHDADAALYRAKKSGKDRVEVAPMAIKR